MMIRVDGDLVVIAATAVRVGAGSGYAQIATVQPGAVGRVAAGDQSWRSGYWWHVPTFGGWVSANDVAEHVVAPPPPPPPPPDPLPVGTLIPAFGASMISDHYNTGPADWIDPATLPAPIPFMQWHDAAQRIVAPSCNGVRPAKLRRINLWGNTTGLYSCVPMIKSGRHRQWNPEVYSGRDFTSITPRSIKDPAPLGVRGQCIVDPYTTWRPHPLPTTPPNAHAPLYVGIEPSGRMTFALPDAIVSPGHVPGQVQPHDLALDEGNTHVFYVANTGNRSIDRVDRSAAVAARPPGGVEDASLYVVTPIATGFLRPTSVEVMRDGTLYACDEDAGAVYRLNPDGSKSVVFNAVRPFCVRRTSTGKLIVATLHLHVYEIDPATGSATQRMPAQYLRTVPPAQREWTWIGVDEYGVLGPVDEFYVADSTATNNNAVWLFRTDGKVLHNAQIFGQQSKTTLGDNSHGEEWTHYAWFVVPHTTQGMGIAQGFANAYPTVFRAPLPSDAPEEPHDHALYRRGQEILKWGSARSSPRDFRPSLTALMTPTGWGLLGITADYIVRETKARGWAWLETFIQSGMGGTTPRPEIIGRDLYGLMYLMVKESQWYLTEGAALVNSMKAYVLAKYPNAKIDDGGFGAGQYNGSETFLRARLASGQITVRGEDKWGNPKAIAAGALVDVIFDEGRTSEVRVPLVGAPWRATLPSLASGLHAVTCRSTAPLHFSYGSVIEV